MRFCKITLKNLRKIFSEYFRNSADLIAESNFSVLKIGSIAAFVVIFLLNSITSTLLPWFDYSAVYIIMPFCSLPLFAIASYFQKHKKSPNVNLWRSFILAFSYLSILMGFIIYISAIHKNSVNFSQIYISIIFVFTPSLVILPQFLVSAFLIISEIIFLFFSYKIKEPLYFYIDFYSSIAAFICSTASSILIWRLRLSEFESRKKFEQLSRIDRLTGILNKVTFEEEVKLYLTSPLENNACTLIILDLDNFKQVNDTLGHLAGDELLESLSHNLLKIFRAEDCVGRIGGDEFCMLIKGPFEKKSVVKKATEIHKSVKKILPPAFEIEVTCSMGIASHDSGNITYQELFSKADVALYKAKKSGKNKFVLYNSETD